MRGTILASVLLGLAVGANSAAAGEPIATTDGESPDMSLKVTELKVSNGVVMLKFTIVNDSSGSFDPDTLNDPRGGSLHDGHAIGGVYLLDAANKKKYLAVFDSENHCVCSRDSHDVQAKSRSNYWVKFPAPPENVVKIGVVVPHFVPLDDVPLSR